MAVINAKRSYHTGTTSRQPRRFRLNPLIGECGAVREFRKASATDGTLILDLVAWSRELHHFVVVLAKHDAPFSALVAL
jgi:hypothetical protein